MGKLLVTLFFNAVRVLQRIFGIFEWSEFYKGYLVSLNNEIAQYETARNISQVILKGNTFT